MEENRKYVVSKEKGLIVLLVLLTGGLILIYLAHRKKAMDRLRYVTVRNMKDVDLRRYDARDQNRIRSLVRNYERKVERAKEKDRILALKEEFDDSFRRIKTTSAKLAEEKMDTIGLLYGQLVGKPGKKNSPAVRKLAEEYRERIRDAASPEIIENLMDEFRTSLREVRQLERSKQRENFFSRLYR